MIKTLQKVGTEVRYINIIKAIQHTHTHIHTHTHSYTYTLLYHIQIVEYERQGEDLQHDFSCSFFQENQETFQGLMGKVASNIKIS